MPLVNPIEILDNFTNINNWNTINGSYITTVGGRVAGTAANNADAFINITPTNVFRLDFKITPSTAVNSIFCGVCANTDATAITSWLSIVFGASYGGFAIYDGGTTTIIKTTASLVTDGSKKYLCQIISTGTETFFTVSDEDGSNSSTLRVGKSVLAKMVNFRVYEPNNYLEKLSWKTAMTKYSDPTFDHQMILKPIFASTQQNYIKIPKDYDGTTRQAVLLLHGNGALANAWEGGGDTNYPPANIALVNAGFITAATDTHGSSWGAPAASQDIKDLYDYLRSMFSINTQVCLLGNSMGGLSALTFALDYPSLVKSIVGTAPASDLTSAYNNVLFTTTINTAYACTVTTMTNSTKTRQPYMRSKELVNIPIKLWQATDDASIAYTSTQNLVAKINEYGGNTLLVTVASGTGGHTSLLIWDSPSIISFFNTAVPTVPPVVVNLYKFK